MIIAVDFDGTISRGKFPAIDGEQPYAGESLRKLHDEGHKIIIWTCRTGDQLLNAINWLLERQIPFDHCYIDDKNIGGFPGWLACMKEIERMEEAYKTILKEDKTKV